MFIFFFLFCYQIFALSDPPVSDRIVQTGEKYLGKPYKNRPLDNAEQETILFHTDFFDCITFIETVLTDVLSSFNFKNKSKEEILRFFRYKNEASVDYSNRLHYFTEWIRQAELNNIGCNISQDLGGTTREKQIFFMTKNREKYPPLVKNHVFEKISYTEKLLSREQQAYLPKEKVKKIVHLLQNGDIIAFTSGLPGLDVNHTGIICLKNGEPFLLHASSISGCVVTDKKPFLEYLREKPSTDGIIVFRVTAGEE